MTGRAKAAEPVSPGIGAIVRGWGWRRVGVALAIVAAVAFALWLRFYRIGEPIAGYHAFNEGFYANIAAQDARRGLFAWITNPIDINNPPLFSLLVSIAFRLFGQSIAVARTVSVLAGLGGAAAAYLLGTRFWGQRAGICSGLVFLLMPGVVIVSRNVQTDALMVALGLGAVLTWVYGARKGAGIGWSVATGVLLGLGMLTKLPAVVVAPGMIAFEIARYRGLAWLKSRRFLVAVATAAVVAVPWYLLRALGPGSNFLASQSRLAASAGDVLRPNFYLSLVVEPFWMIGAAALVAFVIGLVVMARSRSLGDVLVATELATAVIFVLVFHFHSYYLLVLTPWVALAAGRGLAAIAEKSPAGSTVLTALIVVALGFSAMMMMQGQKWGQWSVEQLAPALGTEQTTTLRIEPLLYDNAYGPAAEFYFPGRVIREGAPIPPGTKLLATLRLGQDPASAAMFLQHTISPVVFGFRFNQSPPLASYFDNGRWTAEWVGPIWRFGMSDTVTPIPHVLVNDSAELKQ